MFPNSRRHRVKTPPSNQMNNIYSQFATIRNKLLLLERKVINLEAKNRRISKLEKKIIKLEAVIKELQESEISDLDSPVEEVLL